MTRHEFLQVFMCYDFKLPIQLLKMMSFGCPFVSMREYSYIVYSVSLYEDGILMNDIALVSVFIFIIF